MAAITRIAQWFGVDDGYVRPPTTVQRGDLVVAGFLFLGTVLNRELGRPFLADLETFQSIPLEYLIMITGAGALIWRRVWPLPVAVFAFTHFFLASTFAPHVGYLLGYQFICFFAIYSAATWARDRQATVIVMGGLVLAMALWLAWDAAVGSGLDSIRETLAEDSEELRPSVLPPIVSAVLQSALINLLYVGGAIWLGRNAWWQARNLAVMREQASTIAAQSAELQRQAVAAERLRIARELHDVVAHHVSMMGVQAGAARTLLDKRPTEAAEALRNVEESSRVAISEMRGLLGALRGTADDSAEDSRAPEPTLAELPALFTEFRSSGLEVEVVAGQQDVALADVPLPIQLSAYRIVQEALTNVQRHSTARSARVSLRTRAPGAGSPSGWIEVEVLDDGRPLPGTSGSGLGQLGMRERVTSHGGSAEIGPRVSGGYRVRVRLPLIRTLDGAPHA